jgi:hypothetical protein
VRVGDQRHHPLIPVRLRVGHDELQHGIIPRKTHAQQRACRQSLVVDPAAPHRARVPAWLAWYPGYTVVSGRSIRIIVEMEDGGRAEVVGTLGADVP